MTRKIGYKNLGKIIFDYAKQSAIRDSKKYLRLDCLKTNEKLKMLPKKNIHIKGNEDVVINGLGFIKIVKETDIVVYTLDEKLISVRNKMI